MSLIIFSGAAQILAVQIYADGAPLAVIIVACLVAGLRFLMYSAAMAPFFRPLPTRWQNGLAFLLTDQAFAASVRRFSATHDPRGGALHFLGGGGALWIMWQLTNAVGFLLGNVIPAAMPAWLARSLKFVPATMLTALILPLIVGAPTLGSPAWAQPKILAAVLAGAVAYVTRSTPKTLAAGMLALWFLQGAMG